MCVCYTHMLLVRPQVLSEVAVLVLFSPTLVPLPPSYYALLGALTR